MDCPFNLHENQLPHPWCPAGPVGIFLVLSDPLNFQSSSLNLILQSPWCLELVKRKLFCVSLRDHVIFLSSRNTWKQITVVSLVKHVHQILSSCLCVSRTPQQGNRLQSHLLIEHEESGAPPAAAGQQQQWSAGRMWTQSGLLGRRVLFCAYWHWDSTRCVSLIRPQRHFLQRWNSRIVFRARLSSLTDFTLEL